MILKTKELKEVASKILLATGVDKSAANLELVANDTNLFLNVTNKEYFVSCKYILDEAVSLRAVVDAAQFLNLVAGLTTDTFELAVKDTYINIKANKSNYKLAMIFENDHLMELPAIRIQNKTVEMPISNDILQSILNVNGKEIEKAKNLDVNELQKLYYIDETGAFSFTTGACLNSFTLEKPVKLLLNDRIVKLFKLFKDDVQFSLGQDTLPNGEVRTKVAFQTADTYVAAYVNCDNVLLAKIQGPCDATKRFISEKYNYSVVLSVTSLSAAISRLMLFTKNSIDKANMAMVPATVEITADDFIITDTLGNTETVQVENGSFVADTYSMKVNLFDLKNVLDSCKNEHITLNCGNGRSVVINRGVINNLIPELKK